MSSPGFVYVLMNPSLPELVKIGKTAGSPEERARQLNSTGIPTPFVVAYKRHFPDCDSAEQYVHTLLESQGYRITPNREFFRAPMTVAIDAILLASGQSSASSETGAGDSTPSPAGGGLAKTQGHEPWAALLEEADNARYGSRGEIQDEHAAFRLYERAAQLGAPEAFIALSEMCSHKTIDGKRKAIDWLREGARKGVRECWAAMADAYSGKVYPGFFDEPDNARKCLRKFFSGLQFGQLNADEQMYAYFRLKKFVEYCELSEGIEASEDFRAAAAAANDFLLNLSSNLSERDQQARRNAVQDLLARATLGIEARPRKR